MFSEVDYRWQRFFVDNNPPAGFDEAVENTDVKSKGRFRPSDGKPSQRSKNLASVTKLRQR